ncbi:MAG: phospholipid ABC transporter ATP-binding protein MlaF [Gammaproteobacteria bacterium]|nr:MAG: phospholipid ABC transporter ATP-binding protein MlaF [Gammaproteobacteria bacterium]
MIEALTGSPADLVEIRDVGYRRGEQTIFDGLSLNIPRGAVTALLGPSGTGKTTLLNLITGQLNPHHGVVLFDGRMVCPCSRRRLYEIRRRMGVLFQNGALLGNLNVFENVAFPLREHTSLPEELIRQIVLMKLHSVGLRGAWQHQPAQLSGGMARRVALARALVMDPDLIIYDEPFAGLDPISMGVIVRLIRQTNDALGITSIVVTHDVAQTEALADLCYLLSAGRVIARGTPRELQRDSAATVRQFMQGLADGPVPFHFPGPDYSRQLQDMAQA